MENYSEIDSIIIIDGKKEYLKSKLSYCTKNRDLKILGITLNHRFFSLRQKNCIKAEVDKLNINQVVFSLKPSIQNKLKIKISSAVKNDIKYFCQMLFLIKLMFKIHFFLAIQYKFA